MYHVLKQDFILITFRGDIMKNSILVFIMLWIGYAFGVYPRAGYRAELSTIAHNVSGTVTIVDENTILVENFNYDGGGIVVYFYLGTEDNNTAFGSGLQVGSDLLGTVYSNDELILHLPGSTTLDSYTAVSVWCVTAEANFGSGTFIEPDPAISWTFDNNGTTSYTLVSYTPSGVPFGTVGQDDPTLLLYLGERYEVTIVNEVSHPFEVLAKGPTSVDDVILLSMRSGVTGSLEGDSTVGWDDPGTDTVAFTLSQSLYDAMTVPNKQPGYRCGIHVSSMRGDFDVCLLRPEGDLNGDCRTNLIDLDLFAGGWLDNNLAP